MRRILFALALALLATSALEARAYATEEDNTGTDESGAKKKWHLHPDGKVHCFGSGGDCIT